MNETTLTIGRRFRGPPDSGNGGYVAGRLAALLGGAAEVTLWRPVPLDRPLRVCREGERLGLHDGAALVAEARPASPAAAAPGAVAFAAAAAAARRAYVNNTFAHCFVCGPARAAGDGLRLAVGDLGDGLAAAPWLPTADLAGADGAVDPVFIWSALDCPSGFAVAGGAPGPLLLGRIVGRVTGRLEAGQRAVVVAWSRGREGRKLLGGSALYDEDGHCLALAESIWFRPRQSG